MKRFLSILALLPGLAFGQVSAGFQSGQVLSAAQLNYTFSLAALVQNGTLNSPTINGGTLIGVSETGTVLSNPTITGGTITGTAVSASTLTTTGATVFGGTVNLGNSASGYTNGFLDNSVLVSTDAFVKQSILAATATLPIQNVTGGTYNFASVGSGSSFQITTNGSGVITAVTAIITPGIGYQVGDCLVVAGGNGDAIIRVATLSGSGIASATVVYGGTNYMGPFVLTGSPLPPGSRTGNITGTLTSNALIIIPSGTLLQGARRLSFDNNTTGAFTVQVKLSNGTGGSTGTGVTLAQGTNNSTSTLLYTDGVNDVWPEVGSLPSGSVPLSGLAAQAANTVVANVTGSSASPTAFAMPSCFATSYALNWEAGTGFVCNTTVNAATLGGATFAAPGPVGSTTASTGAFTTLSASGTVSGTGFSTYLASPPAIGGTTPSTGNFTTLTTTTSAKVIASNTSAQSIANNSVVVVTGWTAGTNRGSAFVASTGIFTAPIAGFYRVTAQLVFNSATWALGEEVAVIVNHNGTEVAQALTFAPGAVATGLSTGTVSMLVSCAASDTISVSAFQTSGAALAILNNANDNYLTIEQAP